MQHIVTETQNGCHSAILNRTNPRIKPTVVHSATTFHENRWQTFRVIMFTDKQANRRTDSDIYITSLSGVTIIKQ